MRKREDGWRICSLCGREVPTGLMTQHHLKPKEKGGVAADRVGMCRPCHKQVHAVFSNAELATSFGTVEALKGAQRLAGFLKWIVKQNPQRVFLTRMSGEHPEGRRRRRQR